MSGKTTIEISTQTRDNLKGIGSKGETYDDVIRRLLRVFEKTQRQHLDEARERIGHERISPARRGME